MYFIFINIYLYVLTLRKLKSAVFLSPYIVAKANTLCVRENNRDVVGSIVSGGLSR
jgi:hypothetical protein